MCRAELSTSDRGGFVAAVQGLRNAAALANRSIPVPLIPVLASNTVEYAARLTLLSETYALVSYHVRAVSITRPPRARSCCETSLSQAVALLQP